MRFLTYFTSLLMAMLLVACGGGGGSAGLTSGSPVPAFVTSAPSILNLGVGASQEFSVGGGKGPYRVSSSSPQVVVATLRNETLLALGGVATGAAIVTLTDAENRAVTIAVNVANLLPLSTNTTAAGFVLGINNQRTFTISGGVPGYTVASADSRFVTATLAGNTVTINTLALSPTTPTGSTPTLIFVRDAAGAEVSVPVTVTSSATEPLATSAPATGLLLTSNTQRTFTITGGVPGYTVQSGDTRFATATVNGNTVTVNALAIGSSTVAVRDAVGTLVTVAVNVTTSSTLPLAVNAPAAIPVAIGTQRTFTITGGVSGYTAESTDPRFVTVSVSGNTLIINANALTLQGTPPVPFAVNVVVRDAENMVSTPIAVTVVSASTLDLFTTVPATVTLPPASTTVFSVGGGVAPYTVLSTNPLAVNATINGSVLTIQTLTLGTASLTIRDAVGRTIPVAVTIAAALDLFTTAPAGVTLPRASTTTFKVGGGVQPYTVVSSNSQAATAVINGDNLVITTLSPRSTANTSAITIRDGAGKSVSTIVTVDVIKVRLGSSQLVASIGQVVDVKIIGGSPPYRAVSANNTRIKSEIVQSPDNANEFVLRLTPLSTPAPGGSGEITVSVVDANNESSENVSVTINSGAPGLGFAPSALTISENDTQDIVLNISNASPTGSLVAFSSDPTLLRATVSPDRMTVRLTTGTSGSRCVAGTARELSLVTISIVDERSATGIAVVSIENNPNGCVGIAPVPLTLSSNTVSVPVTSSPVSVIVSGGSGRYVVSSSNNNVATAAVSETGGTIKITPLIVGNTTITVQDTVNLNFRTTIAVTVTP